MRNHQSNPREPKSNEVSAVVFVVLLLVGIIFCGLSFLFDQAVIDWVKTHDLKPLKQIAGFLSQWGDWPELMLFGSIGLGVAWIARSQVVCKVLLCMMIAATISGAVVNSVRLITGRARPNNTEAKQEWNGLWHDNEFFLFENKYHSFPSGHTGAAFAFFGVPPFANRRYGWCALFAAAAIAWSRIYLNVHHLSDVMVSVVAGLVTAYIVWRRLESPMDRFVAKFLTPRR
jgi:membrane-associated phospholipid phosphatase